MNIQEYRQDGFLISTDRSRLDLAAIHGFLSRDSYWAVGRPLVTTRRSIETSLCFGLFDPRGRQAGFARTVVEHPKLKDVKRLLLATRDAHELYRRHGGFTPLSSPERWMERVRQPS